MIREVVNIAYNLYGPFIRQMMIDIESFFGWVEKINWVVVEVVEMFFVDEFTSILHNAREKIFFLISQMSK